VQALLNLQAIRSLANELYISGSMDLEAFIAITTTVNAAIDANFRR
jgi:hypothetical protein